MCAPKSPSGVQARRYRTAGKKLSKIAITFAIEAISTFKPLKDFQEKFLEY